jgi:thiol-disulfide isomerase/thioredoxin
MSAADTPQPPDALLLISSGCPFCATVLKGLAELVKAGRVARLEVVNLTVQPEAAERYGVRGVPWLRLGPFELEGLRSEAELARWAERAGTQSGMADYLSELLAAGELQKVVHLVSDDSGRFTALLSLLTDPDTDLHVRLGIGAVVETLAGSAGLEAMIAPLAELTRHADPRTRGDACHYLALTRGPAARPHIAALLQDSDADVREVAAESLDAIASRE